MKWSTPFVLGLMAALTTPSPAQYTRPGNVPPPVWTAIMAYLPEKSLHEELKLSTEQAKKLAALNRRYFGDALLSSSPATAEGVAAREESYRAIEQAFAEILNEDQQKRFRQIVLQVLERSPQTGGPRIAAQPDLANALQLTDDQKAKLTEPGRLTPVLTDAQKAKWKDLIGAEFNTPPKEHDSDRGDRWPPVEVLLLQRPAVQSELTLSGEQKTRVPRNEFGSNDLTVKDVETLLKPEQYQRLQQLLLQNRIRTMGYLGVFTSSDVAGRLKLSEDQLDERDVTVRKQKRALEKEFIKGGSYDEIAARIEDQKKAGQEALLALLSPEQLKTWREMIGEPFKGDLFPRSVALPRRLTLLQEDAVRKELRLTEAEIQQITKVREKCEDTLSGPDTLFPVEESRKRAAASSMADTLLKVVLKPEQSKRLAEIILQQRVAAFNAPLNTWTSSGNGPGNGTIYLERDIVAALKLTHEQVDKLKTLNEDAVLIRSLAHREGIGFAGFVRESALDQDIRKQAERKMLGVLTEDQRKAWEEMLGKPFEGLRRDSPGGFGGGFGGGVIHPN